MISGTVYWYLIDSQCKIVKSNIHYFRTLITEVFLKAPFFIYREWVNIQNNIVKKIPN